MGLYIIFLRDFLEISLEADFPSGWVPWSEFPLYSSSCVECPSHFNLPAASKALKAYGWTNGWKD